MKKNKEAKVGYYTSEELFQAINPLKEMIQLTLDTVNGISKSRVDEIDAYAKKIAGNLQKVAEQVTELKKELDKIKIKVK